MIVRLRLYDATAYQDDGAQMDSVIMEVEAESDDSERRYTVGRLFFSPEQAMDLLGDEQTLVTVNRIGAVTNGRG